MENKTGDRGERGGLWNPRRRQGGRLGTTGYSWAGSAATWCALLLLIPVFAGAQDYVVDTIAGTGLPPSPVPALSVGFPAPRSAAVDSSGNLYFNSGGRWIFKVDPAGVLTRVAGRGVSGYSGDDGPAADALLELGLFSGMAVDAAGNLHVAAGRVRKISPGGIITTVPNISGLSLAFSPAGRLYASQGDRVVALESDGSSVTVAGNGARGFSGDGGPAIKAQISDPQQRCLAFDKAGNLYIADTFNHRIRRVSPDGLITTVAGSDIAGYAGDGGPATSAQLLRPRAIVVDSNGTLFIEDGQIPLTPAHGLRKVAGGMITAATAQPAELLAIDRNDALYLYQDSVIKRMSATGAVTTIAGNGSLSPSSGIGDNGPAGSSLLSDPTDVAVDRERNVYIVESTGHRVRRISRSGTITTVAGDGTRGFSGDNGPAVRAQLGSPQAVAADSDGNIYIADGSGRIRRVTPSGIISTVAGGGDVNAPEASRAIDARFSRVTALAADRGSNVYIADAGWLRVFRVTPRGEISTFAGTGGPQSSGDGAAATRAAIGTVSGLALDSSDNLYLLAGLVFPDRIRKVTPAGVISTLASGDRTAPGFNLSRRISVDSAGNLFVSDGTSIVRFPPTGGVGQLIAGSVFVGLGGGDGGPAHRARLGSTQGVAVDVDGNVYFSQPSDGLLRVLRPQPANPLSVENAASFQTGTAAPASLATARGRNLVLQTLSAPSTGPVARLGGAGIRITDSRGLERDALISYVSPEQVNFVVPAGLAHGVATIRIEGGGERSSGPVKIAPISPGLFVFRPSGLAAANVLRVSENGQSSENVYELAPDGSLMPALLDFGSDRLFLILYGTGIRGRSNDESVSVTIGPFTVRPLYAGPHASYAGLDQVNIEILRGLIGQRNVQIQITVDGQVTNAGTVSFR